MTTSNKKQGNRSVTWDNDALHETRTVNTFGLPLDMHQARTVTSSEDGFFGEISSSRSVKIVPSSTNNVKLSCPPPPSLRFQASLGCVSIDKKQKEEYSSYMNNIPLTHSPVPCTWTIPNNSIKPVPEFYPLEESSVFVENSSSSEIAIRISDCLCRRYIAASFSDTNAKVKCRTNDGVEFRVRIYTGRGEYSNGYIVEVQRRNGWTPLFQQDSFAILDAAEGLEKDDDLWNQPCFDECIEEEMKKCEDDVTSNLANLIFNGNMDEKRLGLTILAGITDPNKVGIDRAVKNVKTIFHDCEETNLQNNLLKMNSDCHEDHSQHNLVLEIICNCIKVATSQHEKGLTIDESWLIDSITPYLINELKKSMESPNEAALATRSLNFLILNSSAVRCKVLKDDLLHILSNIIETRKVRNHNLEDEVRKGIALLADNA